MRRNLEELERSRWCMGDGMKKKVSRRYFGTGEECEGNKNLQG